MYKILLVDDDAVVRRGVRCSIPWAEHGFEICAEAGDGRQALRLIEERAPDILLTDIKMPVCDGLWLCERAAERFPDMPMIIMSGYEDFSYAQQALHLGVKEYIVKPVEAEKLIETLNRIVRERTGQGGAAGDQILSLLPEGVGNSQIALRAIRFVEGNYMKRIDVKTVSGQLFLSESYFSRQFKQDTGVNFTEFLNRYRLECAKKLMKSPDLKITDVAEMVGYQSYKYFHQIFVRFEGYPPTKYRERALLGAGEARP